jgi:hypothetical protein
MNKAIKRRKGEKTGWMLPAGIVPEWMLGKPLMEWYISQLPEAEAGPMLARLKQRLEEKEREDGGKAALA